MTGPWPHKPFTFRALRKTFGAMWLRCDVCRRYAPLSIGGLQNVDYRSKTFSCSRCGSEAHLALIEPVKETGMQDYRLDTIERPERHPAATDRLMGRGRSAPVDYSGGELPGRKVDEQSLELCRRAFLLSKAQNRINLPRHFLRHIVNQPCMHHSFATRIELLRAAAANSKSEQTEEADALKLIADQWKRIGISMLVKLQTFENFWLRTTSGEAMMTAYAGLFTAVPNPITSPKEFVPTMHGGLQWPKWGISPPRESKASRATFR